MFSVKVAVFIAAFITTLIVTMKQKDSLFIRPVHNENKRDTTPFKQTQDLFVISCLRGSLACDGDVDIRGPPGQSDLFRENRAELRLSAEGYRSKASSIRVRSRSYKRIPRLKRGISSS